MMILFCLKKQNLNKQLNVYYQFYYNNNKKIDINIL